MKPFALVILDGFGIRAPAADNAISNAKTPTIDFFLKSFPHSTLAAAGPAVGLPPGFIGGSQVGHLTIGAGRVIEQPLTRILNAIDDGSFFENPLLHEKLDEIRNRNAHVHLIGLISDAGVHGHERIVHACMQAAAQHGVPMFVHAILDGRDVLPRSAATYLEKLETSCTQNTGCSIGSLHGRFYAMDRNKNWDRTKRSYDTIMQQHTEFQPRSWQDVLQESYKHNITDEFVMPTLLLPAALVNNDDGIIMCNIRSERSWQLAAALSNHTFSYFPTVTTHLSCFVTPVEYHHDIHATVLLPQKPINDTLTQVLAKHNKTIFSIAETEKYAHVTYFFNGESTAHIPTQTTVLVPSIRNVKTYADYPAMSAAEITNQVIHSLTTDPHDVYIINYANADMVGHSGNFDATVRAIECLDHELGRLYNILVKTVNGTLIITADHGNAEQMHDLTNNQPHTAHTANPVPFIVISNKKLSLPPLPHELADIAPFILQYMGIGVPTKMNKEQIGL